jgi:hypothetical protein
MNKKLRLLILEDQATDAELCERELKRAGLHITSHRVDTRAAFEAALDQFAPELDVSLMEGLDVFHRATTMGLHGSQVAYVISGRPWSITATALEAIARRRGIHLRFFLDRDCALQRLGASAGESGRVA